MSFTPLDKLSPEDWEKVQSAFSHCLQLSPEDRNKYLKDGSGLEPWVVAEVESLLKARERHRTLFSEPFLDGLAKALPPEEPPAPLPLNEPLLGRFEIVEALGSGGMADVYRARLFGAQGFKKDVAIKLMAGGFSRNQAAREAFE